MRQACVRLAAELLAEFAPILGDADLKIVGSLNEYGGTVCLIVEGGRLPEECDAGDLREVRMQFVQETYGRQRLIRLSEIVLVD
jgi:hypothetical protein